MPEKEMNHAPEGYAVPEIPRYTPNPEGPVHFALEIVGHKRYYTIYCATCGKRHVYTGKIWRGQRHCPACAPQAGTPRGEGPGFYHLKKRQKERFPERVEARNKVRRAIRQGKLLKGGCEVCGSPETEGHHEDYSKPLEVRWFCDAHHPDKHHEKEKEE